MNWQPSSTIATLAKRAALLKEIRTFFAARHVMEVETPLLCATSVPDPFIQSIPACVKTTSKKQIYYLQTSPEYAMKRLLAAGSGSIYQICKAFRQEEKGRFHNPEFTMLEWYRLGFDHHQLMDEMDDLLQLILEVEAADRISYLAVFETYLGINPHLANLKQLADCAKQHTIDIQHTDFDKNTWLQLLFSHLIEPKLGEERPCFIYDFPASQAALARIRHETYAIASRFEVYFKGVELANGFHELQNAKEQRKRFENNLLEREKAGLPILPIDEQFLAALEHGLPDCAGVALGLDRLCMLAYNKKHIAEVLSFDISIT